MRSLATLVWQISVKYRWNLVIAWQNVLFWRGSIKRLDLQTTYRYRAVPFWIYFYRIELPYCVVTRSDHMRVSHNGTSNLKILEIFKHFWPALEPCKQRTSRVRGSILSVLVLRTHTSLSNWVKYRWNLVIAWQNVLFWRGSIKRLDLQTTYRYRAVPFWIYFYRIELPYCVVTRSDHMRVSHNGTSNLKILEIFKHFWPALEPCK